MVKMILKTIKLYHKFVDFLKWMHSELVHRDCAAFDAGKFMRWDINMITCSLRT